MKKTKKTHSCLECIPRDVCLLVKHVGETRKHLILLNFENSGGPHQIEKCANEKKLWPTWLGDGIDLWGCALGVRDTGWIRAMELIYGVCDSGWIGRWDWFVGAHCTGWIGAVGLVYGSPRYWLGDGIDSWGCAKWQSNIWLLKLNDDTMCPHVWCWGKCAECIWLRGW